jgi:hypothetical protein
MAEDDPPRGPSRGTRAQNLLNRFPVTDLARAVSRSGADRRFFLTEFVDSGTKRNYVPTRRTAPMIYGASPPLLEISLEPWGEVEKNIRALCDPLILDMNISASRELFNLVRPKGYLATICDEQTLRTGHNQIVPVGLTFYITEGDRLIFQFPQPRLDCLTDSEVVVLASVIFHAYAKGDYADADIEVAELGRAAGAPRKCRKRDGRIRLVAKDDIIERNRLGEQVDDVYGILRELVTKPRHK